VKLKLIQLDTKWYKMVQNGTKWYKMVQNGTKWYKMVQNGDFLRYLETISLNASVLCLQLLIA
jgi:hypothetical protein